ncbi:hypothetical protein GUITHDRAFT_104118 [Guillardia theta CCMP2712]|uniref:peptidylprolyl isomerase n=1 Tax=Guillardia theta (strain CCMP2712) TaxID=905079 RepID=L1JQF7_GUITC|nr:hypothetical protein GUITHDRAFT_104118 [Guillardia theta CCMP2712]EKX50308.1 hypothetical protein GUITHDRAFT_104118 [Guillardia theta CCMP2712]|eukprot:XP_005837288.1 hypothetical protein GUITHDRAFT_104118 [Guillardia theta CCMP2712]
MKTVCMKFFKKDKKKIRDRKTKSSVQKWDWCKDVKNLSKAKEINRVRQRKQDFDDFRKFLIDNEETELVNGWKPKKFRYSNMPMLLDSDMDGMDDEDGDTKHAEGYFSGIGDEIMIVDLPADFNFDELRQDLPIMGCLLMNNVVSQVLKNVKHEVLTPTFPELSVVKKLNLNHYTTSDKSMILFRQSFRHPTVSSVTNETLRSLLKNAGGAMVPMFVVEISTWGGAVPKMYGYGIFISPINCSSYLEGIKIPMDLFWEIGVPTNMEEFEEWKERAIEVLWERYKDGSIRDSPEVYKSCQERFGKEEEEEEEEEPEIATKTLEEDKRISKNVVEEGYGPGLFPGDEVTILLSVETLRAREEKERDDDEMSDGNTRELQQDELEVEENSAPREPSFVSLTMGEDISTEREEVEIDGIRTETCTTIQAGLKTMIVGECSAFFMIVEQNDFELVENYTGSYKILFVQIRVVAKNLQPLNNLEGIWAKFDHPYDISNQESPNLGDIVVFEYNISFRGQVVIQSDKLTERDLGAEDDLIEGIRIALSSNMLQGSRVKMTLHSSFAFGEEGVTGCVPPDEFVDVDLVLLYWHRRSSFEDGKVNVTEKGHVDDDNDDDDDDDDDNYYEEAVDLVLIMHFSMMGQKVARHPNRAVCTDGSLVHLRLFAYCHNIGVFGNPYAPAEKIPKELLDYQSLPQYQHCEAVKLAKDVAALHEQLGEGMGIFHKAEDVTAVIGDGDLPRGLEVALLSGRMQETTPVPNPFPVSYLVKIVQVDLPLEEEEAEQEQVQARESLPLQARLESANLRRERANFLFKRGAAEELQEAKQLYLSASSMATEYGGSASASPPHLPVIRVDEMLDKEELRAAALTTQLTCLLNLAVTLLRLQLPQEAMKTCDRALLLSPTNSKALKLRDKASSLIASAG